MTFRSEFSFMKVWFTDQDSKPFGNKFAEKIKKISTKNTYEDSRISLIAQTLQPAIIPAEIYITPKKGQQIFGELGLL